MRDEDRLANISEVHEARMPDRMRVILMVAVPIMLILAMNVLGFQQAKSGQSADRVLERMAAVGKNFHSFSALFTQKKYTALLKEFDAPESGVFMFMRAKDGSALLRQEIKAPGHRVLTIKGGVATLYQPSLNQATLYNLGKNKDKAEYLALGIGQAPIDLHKTFDIDYQGADTLDGAPCSVLVLKPKDPSTASNLASITLWIKNSNNLSIQQKLEEPNGDYLLVKFSSEKLNPQISESEFVQKLPKGVEIQQIR